MSQLPERQLVCQSPGSVDWIYWLDISNWDSALVLDNSGGQQYKLLDLYFNHVVFAKVNSLDKLEKALKGVKLNKFEFDLIVCSDLLNQLSSSSEAIKVFLSYLDSILSINGKILLGYFHGWKSIGFTIDKLLMGDFANSNPNIFNWLNEKRIKKAVVDYIKNSKFCQPPQPLYVYPNYKRPLTISDSELLVAKIQDWKKKKRKNRLFIWLIKSRLGSRTFKKWWPQRIVLLSKQLSYGQ